VSEPPPIEWAGLAAWLARHFPDVASIGPGALAARIERGDPLLLVDVRTPEEQAVSTIPGALCVGPGADPRSVPVASPAATVVVYCAVGVRSARLARGLAAAGCTGVHNLERGLFGWANEGRPLAGPQGAASRVHRYDDAWQALLDPRLRA
jgi:rhodanese-related sulfurtransferase